MKVLDLTLPSPEENLACDEALLEAADAGQAGECLRFWESPVHFVVVGYANQVAHEVNAPACEAAGVPILRRCSGGGTVLQGPGCLNYAVVLPIVESGPTRNIHSANQFVMERTRAAIAGEIRSPAVEIRVQGHTDLTLGERKFSGNAQRRLRRYLLFHGTLLLDFDLPLMSRYLRLPERQPDYRRQRSHDTFIVNLAISSTVVKSALRSAWAATEVGERPPARALESLIAQKYARRSWNLRR